MNPGFRIITLLAAALCLALSPAAQALTQEEETRLGKEFMAYVRGNMELMSDPELNRYLTGLGRRILAVLPPQPFEYHFYLVKDDAINAAAGPGGNILVYSGLVAAFETEGQLAAILAHEIAHSVSRHIAQNIERAQKLNWATLAAVVAGILVGGQVGAAVATGSVNAGIVAQLKYSREDEAEADYKALNWLSLAGYDPHAMEAGFDALYSVRWQGPGDTPEYLLTHPPLAQRQRAVANWIAAHPERGGYAAQGDAAFLAFKAKVIARASDRLGARNFFNSLLKTHPAQAHHGLGLTAMESQDLATAQRELKTAAELAPANLEILTDLAALSYRQGRFAEAEATLSRVLIMDPDRANALFYLARITQEQNRLERARDIYLRLLGIDPLHAQAHYYLGKVYGELGDIPRAHYHLGLSFELGGQKEQAAYHFTKAQEALGTSTGQAKELAALLKKKINEIQTRKD